VEHREEARRNLQSCQTCHPDGEDCIQCHRAGAGFANPHPRNWRSIKGVYQERNSRTCFKCHVTIP
jgi:hypothetical protein